MSHSPALAAALNAMAPTPKTDLYAHARARALMVGYDERWSGKWQHYDILEVEHEFTFPLLNPDTEGSSRTFVEAGKIDVKVRNRASGQLEVLEHKCLGPETRIFNHRTGKFQTIQALCDAGEAPLVSAMAIDGSIVLAQAGIPVLQPKRPALIITTKSGRQITASHNHPFWTESGWVAAANLAVGMELSVAVGTPSASSIEEYPDHAIKVMGYLIADGGITTRSIQFTKGDPSVMSDFVACARLMGENAEPRYPSNKAPYCHCSTVGQVSDLLNAVGLRGCGSAKKHIPDIAMSDRQCGILIGALWSTDGCIDARPKTSARIIYSSVSKQLCLQVQELLQRLGMTSVVTDTSAEYRGSRRPFHQVQVVGRWAKRKFLELAKSGSIPVVRSAITIDDAISTIRTAPQGGDNRRGLRCVGSMWYDAITDIAMAGEVDLYDLEVPGVHTFVANGFVTHNTTQDPVDPASDYWDRLRMDAQVSKYFIATAQFGEQVGGVIYDAIRKPAQRMTNIPLLDADGVKIVRDANGERVRTKDGKKWRESADAAAGYTMETRPERPDEHEARVLAIIREDPERFYGQRKVTRMDSDILEFMNDEWSLSQQILYFRNRNLWPRNPAACNAYGTCEFFDLCCGRVSVDGVNYRPRERAHAELTIQGHNGLELLTNSRATALRKCARYHQHRYETPIERVGGEESEALFFGTLIHRGLEAYFNALKSNV